MKRHLLPTAVAGLAATTLATALTAVATGATTAAPSQAGPTGSGCAGPLDILLTNDDGWQAPGIQAVRTALVDAGHRVTTVAPANEQSGKGGAITTGGTIAIQQQTAGEAPVWSVAGTPVDSVRVGLELVLAGRRPDLVVSGANFGENVARGIVSGSGTVAAANSATNYSRGPIPAIDVSVEMNLAEVTATPRFKSTLAAFPGAAAFTAELVADLQDDCTDGRLLPDYQQLHVNYPARQPSEIRGTEVTEHTTTSTLELTYTDPGGAIAAGGGDVKVGYRPTDPAIMDGDAAALHDGNITIVVFDGDISAPASARALTRTRLDHTLAD